jgi:RNA polymerase sigma-70 factor, ECF subfamily
MDHPPTDEELLAGFMSGRREMFEALVRRYEEPLYAFIYRMNGNTDDAAEIFQETCLRAFRHAGSFGGKSRFKTWLYSIAMNVCRSRWQRTRRSHQIGHLSDNVPSDGPDPPSDAASQELSERIAEAMDELPDEQREVVVFKVYEDMSFPEIAQALSRPVGTVKSQMRYALQRLRATLAGLDE